MYKSRYCVVNKSKSALVKDFLEFLKCHNFSRCKSINNRKVFFEKQPEAILERKNVKNRLEAFIVAIDILKKSHSATYKGALNNQIEVMGYDKNGKIVKIHLREESINKNKKLFFISCFWNIKKIPTP